MILEVYRLHSKRYPANSGRGAALHGGRWNPPGVEAIYTAQSRSLAALEILVHYAVLPRDFVLTPIRIPEDRVVVARLQKDAQFPELQQTRDLTLNPAHPEFEYIEFLDSEPFKFDPRLKQIV